MTSHPDPEQLSAYIDGELNDDDRDDLEQHLTGCSDCSATLRALRATLADVRALPAPVPSEQESWALRAAINKARKRPGKRYSRWAVAAGTVAAVFAAIVVLANNKTASSTFSHTGNEVTNGAASAPQDSRLSLIEVDSTNYTSVSASRLLETPVMMAPAVPPPVGAPNGPGSGGTGSTMGGTTSSQKAADTLSGAQRASFATAIQRCEQQVLPADTSNLKASRYIVGTFEDTPVFFLVYSVTSRNQTKFELWAVQRSDCYIRFYVPPR